MYYRNYTGTVGSVLCREVCFILCPYLGESTISEVSPSITIVHACMHAVCSGPL